MLEYYQASCPPVSLIVKKGKGKGHPCTGTEAMYRPVRPIGGVEI